MVSGKVVIKNPTGLHLRPAGLFCKTAMQYKSKITVHKELRHASMEDDYMRARSADVKDISERVLSVLGACVKSGDEIEIICEGEDEAEALKAMLQLVMDGLGE